nr:hypothetical protein [uncultured Mogibacterium sp.]
MQKYKKRKAKKNNILKQVRFDIPVNMYQGILKKTESKLNRSIISEMKNKASNLDVKKAAGSIPTAIGMGETLHKHKKKLPYVIIAGVVVAGGKIIMENNKMPLKFLNEIKKYISAIRVGCMDYKTINNMYELVKKIRGDKNYGEYYLIIESWELDGLIEIFQEYTIKLAEANSVNLAIEPDEKNGDCMYQFEGILLMQKQIIQDINDRLHLNKER